MPVRFAETTSVAFAQTAPELIHSPHFASS